MVHDGASFRIGAGRAALVAAALTLACFAGTAADAQNFMRSPNLNIGPRIPTIHPNIAGRVNANVAGRVNGANISSTNVAGHVSSNGPVRVYTATVPAHPPVHANVGVTGAPIPDPGPRLTPGIAVIPQLPYVRYSPNLYPVCGSAYRDSDGECLDQPVLTAGGGSGGGGPAPRSKNGVRASMSCRPRSIPARSRTNSSPKSTAHCPTRRPTNWRAVTD